MTDTRFQYDERLLYQCANSPVAKYIEDNHMNVNVDNSRHSIAQDETFEKCEEYCYILFELYMKHYHRRHTHDMIQIIRYETSSTTSTNTGLFHEKSVVSFYQYLVGTAMQHFIRNVILINHHNSNPIQQQPQYRLTLNRFSDQDLNNSFSRYASNSTPTSSFLPLSSTTHSGSISDNKSRRLTSTESSNKVVKYLSSIDEIQTIGLRHFSVGGRHDGFIHQINKYTKRQPDSRSIQFDLYPTKLRLPTTNMISRNENINNKLQKTNISSPFQSSPIFDDESHMDGSLVYIARNKHSVLDNDDNNENVDVFATNINWATTNNPDGVSIVQDPIDQVRE
jgi:hypothetical protein